MSHFFSKIIDLFWILTGVGIWPRFIEPSLLNRSKLPLWVPDLPEELEGLKIVQFTDLHINGRTSPRFLKRLRKKIMESRPDLIVFTGDFLCYAKLDHPLPLQTFLSSLSAPLGCYCILGNHDYSSYVTRSGAGDYRASPPPSGISGLIRICTKSLKKILDLKRKKPRPSNTNSVPLHKELVELLEKTPFELLENRSIQINVKESKFNICGVGEYALGRCDPKLAFENYLQDYPGIVLAHNPDAFEELQHYPGDLILCGHTHGEQIHLPLPFLRTLSRRLVGLNNPQLTRGFYNLGGKKLFVNRGVGGPIKFRLFSAPQICTVEVKRCQTLK